MNIRKTDRGQCRVCDYEIYKQSWGKFRTKGYRLLTNEERDEAEKISKELTEKYKKDNEGNLFALDASTASGTRTEIICRKHLEKIVKDIKDQLGITDETHSPTICEGIEWKD